MRRFSRGTGTLQGQFLRVVVVHVARDTFFEREHGRTYAQIMGEGPTPVRIVQRLRMSLKWGAPVMRDRRV